VDCDDPDCIGRPLCREPIPGKLDLFVMAFCPFGRNAMAVADRVWTHFEGELTVELHWITTELTAGAGAWDDLPERCGEWGGRIFCSLHGTEETAEDLRQICIQDRYGTPRLMDYLRCLHGAADGTPWSECASAAGIDDGEIGLCAGGLEGPELLSADAALVEALGVDGSPTWMWDNHIVESISATPEAVAARACELHPDLGGCETLDEIESAPTGIGSDAKCWD